MSSAPLHTFHIPVMGLAYTIDSPLKVARFGISSVVSLADDNLTEAMRKFHCNRENISYVPIARHAIDSRARRITAYLNLLDMIVEKQTERLRSEQFVEGSELEQYFKLLPESSPAGILFAAMNGLEKVEQKKVLQEILRRLIRPGSIDVNIMTKVDKANYSKTGMPLAAEYADAMAALRGFANSRLASSVVFSAGMNPRLYSYCESFNDFLPAEDGSLKKKIILKVSDYRSAMIQGKFLAKKGLWVSEFRIESGLNCGGHAFATDGYLLGPIMEEFRTKKEELSAELFGMCNNSLLQKGMFGFPGQPGLKISVQGGIGTANEHDFLLDYYHADSTGWGSPFLLVPEATNVDAATLEQIASAKREDYYLSNASPLGVPFNNLRNSSADQERIRRITKGEPGSPCYNKFLSFNTEFTDKPICLASREYQNLKIRELMARDLPPDVLAEQIETVTEKECICSGLATPVYLVNEIPPPHRSTTVSICPGPNLAYFSGIFPLSDMIDHIYGRKNLLNTPNRPNMFLNELQLYVDYLKKEIAGSMSSVSAKQSRYLKTFKDNLLSGIEYYRTLASQMIRETEHYRQSFIEEMSRIELCLAQIDVPDPLLI